MKTREMVLGFAAGVVAAMLGTAGVLRAQTPEPIAPAAAPVATHPVTQVPGSVQVTRLTDTLFVVVKDQGDAQVVTLFTTEAGLVQKKHAGRFLY